MTPITYLDFDLAIDTLDPTTGRHRVRVLNSPAGQADGEFVLPFDGRDLEVLFLRLGRPRRGVRRIGSPEMTAAQNFGSTLYNAVFSPSVQGALLRSLDLAPAKGAGLRLRLRLNGAPGLMELPWEFLFDTVHQRFLVHSTATPIVRYLELPSTVPPLTVPLPLQVLVMIANPHDHNFGQLDVEGEWQKVQAALAPLVAQQLVTITRVNGGSLRDLQRALRGTQYHVFHFIGHGGFDAATKQGLLLLTDEQGRSRPVAGHHLGTLLRDHPSLRLALLNACEGARTTPDDPFAGVAQGLVQTGIPAVIAMQFEITDQAAATLAEEFYAALTDGYPVEAALAEARKAIYGQGNDVEWGTPVLYLRAADGLLFQIDKASAPPVIVSQATPPESRSTNQASRSAQPPIAFDWVTIPAGEFIMGSDKAKDNMAFDDELPQFRLYLPEYQIMRAPLTVAQFAQFIKATGYKTTAEKEGNARVYTGSKWEWVDGADWAHPRGPQSDVKQKGDHPVTCISWLDAVAFAEWAKVRLPTEAEWEKAARGIDGRIYPWGNEVPDKNRCNFAMNEGDTTPVGKYPKGASPDGALDMAGNVWEWTSTMWLDNYADYTSKVYNRLTGDGRRVVRGGSFGVNDYGARATCRFGLESLFWDDLVGVRFLLSPSLL